MARQSLHLWHFLVVLVAIDNAESVPSRVMLDETVFENETIIASSQNITESGSGWLSNHNGQYKIYQIRPRSEEHMRILEDFEKDGIVDFWRLPVSANSSADVMVDGDSEHSKPFFDFLRKAQLDTRILVDDLAKFIDEKETIHSPKFSDGTGKWQRDSPTFGPHNSNTFGLVMGEYHSYDDILAFMARVEGQLPRGVVQLRSIGRSSEGRDIRGIQFGRPRDTTRPVVWIDAGIHSREWTAIHTAVYFIYHIANEILSGKDSPLLKYLESIDVLILPCVNPDGYEYTKSDPRNPLVRFWRKSRSAERCDTDNSNQMRCCRGVDLNRNFDFRFAETGTSYFPCSEIFHGSGAFSEPETRAIRDAVLNSDLRGRIAAMVTMHAYSQLWIYPFSHRKHAYPPDINELKAVARKAVTAIGEKFGTHYMYGTGPEIIYAYAGGSADWAKQTANIKYTYTIELRPNYWSWNGFILERSQLIPTARETFDGVLVVLESVYNNVNKLSGDGVASKLVANQSPPKPNPGPVAASSPTWPGPKASGAQSTEQPQECKDKVSFCRQWLSRHPTLCRESPSSMRRDCAKTCNTC
ncbi:zinc carboxypeptidase domain-containing protein [Ditylenchus destructor]|nr:zinc carboxypeptidase domain-containing protein [Ditylenchus destructor]